MAKMTKLDRGLNACELAILAYFSQIMFSDHTPYAHPAVVADLVARKYLAHSGTSYVVTYAGIEAAEKAGYTALLIESFQEVYCGKPCNVPASLACPVVLVGSEYQTTTGAGLRAKIVDLEKQQIMLVAMRPRAIERTPANPRTHWVVCH